MNLHIILPIMAIWLSWLLSYGINYLLGKYIQSKPLFHMFCIFLTLFGLSAFAFLYCVI